MTANVVPDFFDRLVLISNSVPKSGSTFLFSLQRNFFQAFLGRGALSYEAFTSAGVEIDGGYVSKPHSRAFLEVATSTKLTGGPYIVKTHTLINGDLREALLNSENLFASLSIRDPIEVFYSARDNYLKTGEFPEFGDLDKGCATVSEYFSKIFQSSVNTSKLKEVPIVRYETIVSDPVGAMMASLHPTIREECMRHIAAGYLSVDVASAGATKRLNKGALSRHEQDKDDPQFLKVTRALAETRTAFGYGQ